MLAMQRPQGLQVGWPTQCRQQVSRFVSHLSLIPLSMLCSLAARSPSSMPSLDVVQVMLHVWRHATACTLDPFILSCDEAGRGSHACAVVSCFGPFIVWHHCVRTKSRGSALLELGVGISSTAGTAAKSCNADSRDCSKNDGCTAQMGASRSLGASADTGKLA